MSKSRDNRRKREEKEQTRQRRNLEHKARKLLKESPRPLSGERPSEYVERAAAAVFARAKREGGTELVREVQRLMDEDVRDEERAKQELIARGRYPVAQVVRLPHGVTVKLTKRAAVLVEDNRVDLGGLLEDYAQRVASGRLGASERAARGGYPIAGSTLVVAWVPTEPSFYAWELGEIPGEEDQPVYREAEPEHPGGEDRAARIVHTMPDLPQPSDPPSVQLQRLARYREWVERVRRQVGRDAGLSDRIVDLMKDRMGLNDPDPARAADNARQLLALGMSEVGMTRRAAKALQRRGRGSPAPAAPLAEEYVDAWTNRGFERTITHEVGSETLCVGKRDGLRINVWVCGEPGMPAAPLDDIDTRA